jgi:hypothetical protein
MSYKTSKSFGNKGIKGFFLSLEKVSMRELNISFAKASSTPEISIGVCKKPLVST